MFTRRKICKQDSRNIGIIKHSNCRLWTAYLACCPLFGYYKVGLLGGKPATGESEAYQSKICETNTRSLISVGRDEGILLVISRDASCMRDLRVGSLESDEFYNRAALPYEVDNNEDKNFRKTRSLNWTGGLAGNWDSSRKLVKISKRHSNAAELIATSLHHALAAHRVSDFNGSGPL